MSDFVPFIFWKMPYSNKMSFKGQESQTAAADGTKVNADIIETKASESSTTHSGPR